MTKIITSTFMFIAVCLGTICKFGKSQDIWQEVNALNYVITFYDHYENDYAKAVDVCNGLGASPVQLDDEVVRKVVYDTIPRATISYFWIGAERCLISETCEWKWVDGTSVDMTLIEWTEGQPDNYGDNENRMFIDRTDNKFRDVPENNKFGGIICQKKIGSDDPWIIDTDKYRLTFYDKAFSWSMAKATCVGHSVNLVILVNGEVREAVYGEIGRAANVKYFWIGAEGGGDNWTWVDGTPVDLGLIDWYYPSPDNTGSDNKMVIRKSDNNFGDVTADLKFGTICQTKLDCNTSPSLCEKGECKGTNVNGFNECKCVPGYFGDFCEYEYCFVHKNPCYNGGSCISNTDEIPFYTCNCTGLGYGGGTCVQELIQVDSEKEAIGIVGGYVHINLNVTSIDGLLNIVAYRNSDLEKPLQNKTDVSNGTVTFTFFINSTKDEGNYTFIAYPKSKEYSRNTSLSITVHVNATIKNVTQTFIFSPITTGPSNVICEVDGIPIPTVTWYNANEEPVAKNSSNGVYQTSNTEIAVLHVENAIPSDDGNYVCKTVNKVGQKSISVSDEKMLVLAVYGSPSILEVEPKKCSEEGIISVEWLPNTRTTEVLHKFEICSLNATISDKKEKFETAGRIVSFDGLQPYTEYSILVVVCPDLCIGELNASDVQTTGHGLPGAVKNASLEQNNENSNLCTVYWEVPNTPLDQIIDYNITSEAKLLYVSPDADETDTVHEENIINTVSNLIHEHETKPNSEYKFFITARTCAGVGQTVTANGSCITKYSAPAEVPNPIINTSADPGPVRQITIPLASETNGPISCSFVIVNRGNNVVTNRTFEIQQLQDAEDAAAAGNNNVDYLAIAIPRENMTSNVYEANLGDNTESSCDVTKIFTGKNHRKRNTASSLYSGKNLVLASGGTEYGYYVVTSTPVDDEARLKRSEIQIFTNGIAEPPSVVGAAVGGAVGGVLVIVLVAAGLYMRSRRNTPEKIDEVFHPPTATDKGNVNPQFVEDEPEIEYENVVADVTNSETEIPFRFLKQKYIELKANESMLFRAEYQKLKAQSRASAPPSTFGGSERFMSKNRYKNILPYDCTRVHLGQEEDQEYINACHVTGYNKRKFIATQGPLSNTELDFWKMVVEQRCKVIVMLTKCNEAGRMKCEQYWPESNQTIEYGDICVRNQAEKYFGGYVVRTMEVISPYNEKLTVVQYQFVQWPDHGVPKTTSSFFRFHKEVMKAYGSTGADAPLLVHCSAGVGRTGTFIGYDILQDETVHQKKTSVDIFSCVLNMRKERVDMVQTCDQYELLHKLLLERYLFGETDVNENEIKEIKEKTKSSTIRDRFEKEFRNLDRAESLKFKSKEDPYHIQDPRDRVVIVRQPGDTGVISFDGTYVEAYNKTIKLIAVRSPLNSTVEYFLRAILDNDINTIVMLDKPGRKKLPSESVQYWPESSNEPLHVKNITVTLGNQRTNRGISERTLIVSRYNMQPKVVTQFGYSSWTTKVTKQNPREILDLVSTVQAYTLQKKESVILVHCSDGLGKSGSFCALVNILERMKNEGQVDVFRAVKDLRDLKSGMVQTLDQYKFCYEVVQARLSTENIYANAVFESEEPQDPVYENIQKI